MLQAESSCLKPSWLKKKLNLSSDRNLKTLLRSLKLHTVCEESRCPNISECFSKGVATFLILGDSCKRGCSFCAVATAEPSRLDPDQPRRIAQAVKALKLEYVVITSPTRDDLSDGGAATFKKTVKAIKALNPKSRVEALVPDFLGKLESIKTVADCELEVIGHNLETVPGLYKKVRPSACYNRSLAVLETIKKLNPAILTKSSLMLGLGESQAEIKKVLQDLRGVSCDLLSLGQYLAPSLNHYPVKNYIHPDIFDYFKDYALKLGFRAVNSGPYVRSSYLAHHLLI